MVDLADIKKLNKNQESLVQLQLYKIQDLERKEELGLLGFSDAMPHADKIVKHANFLSSDLLAELPASYQKAIGNSCQDVLNKFSQILAFNHNQQNPTLIRDQLITQLEPSYKSFFDNTIALLTYTVSQKNEAGESEEEFKKLVSNFKLESAAFQKSAKEKLEEANTLVESIKNASAKEGTLKQAEHFSKEKGYHRKRAQWWSAATAIAALTLITYTILSVELHTAFKIDLAGPDKEALSWQVQTTKILIFAVLAYLLVLSVRNFMAHKHNMVVNSHREVALYTFEALANAANQDTGARDIILNHAAACIFTPQDTGYAKSHLNDTGTNLGNASLIVNLAKQAIGKD